MSRKFVSAAVVGALLVLIATVIVVLRPQRTAKSKQKGPVPVVQLEGSDMPDLGPATLEIADPSAYAGLNSGKTTALQDVRIVEGLLQNMQQSFKTAAPPMGFNEEITRALTGRNPLELAFIPSTHPAINARGLLCDRWGTPFHFHPMANDRIDVRSAGPDRKLFTADDVSTAPLTTSNQASVEEPAPDASSTAP